MATRRSSADETEATTEGAPEDGPQVEAAVITTKTKDYMNRALVNIATAGVDYMGRSVIAGDKDYMGRALVA
jgi:hypothetical protein